MRQKTPRPCTLTDLVQGFMEYAETQGVKDFPTFGNKMWHELLYAMARNTEFHALLPDAIGEFYSDSPYPKSRDLVKKQQWLMHLCDFASPAMRRIVLSDDALRIEQLIRLGRWNVNKEFNMRFDAAIKIMYEKAKSMDSFFST